MLRSNSVFALGWHFVRPYRKRCAILLLLVTFWAIDLSARPYLLKLIINSLGEGATRQAIPLAVLVYIGCGVLVNVTMRLAEYICIYLSPRLKADIIRGTFAYVQNHSHFYFQNNHAGSIGSRVVEMSRSIDVMLFQIINHFLHRFLALSIAIATLAAVHVWFAIVLAVWAVIFFASSYVLTKHTKERSHRFSEGQSILLGKIIDTITNISTVRLFSRQPYEDSFIGGYVDRTVVADEHMRWAMLKQKALMATTVNILNASFVFSLLHFFNKGLITIGDFALVITVSIAVTDAVWNIGHEMIVFFENYGRCRQTISLVTSAHDVKDKEGARDLVVSEGAITFSDVTFSHRAGYPLFKSLSFSIAGHQRVGIVGTSGSGKSTLSQLLTRLYDLDAGSIAIDGQRIDEVTQASLRQAISYIPQEPCLFHRTIMENIRYGNLEASDEEVFSAARRAGAYGFINQLPLGFDTVVGERGLNLSGGQRQRIIIARALLKKAPILILDEPTSSLDPITEAEVDESIHSLLQGQTVITITHRLSTIRHMDRLLVFRNGEFVDDGTHDELLRRGGYYRELWSKQMGSDEADTAPAWRQTIERVAEAARNTALGGEVCRDNDGAQKTPFSA